MDMKRVVAALLVLGVFACTASAAGPIRVSLTGKRAAPVAGRAWTARLAVRPRSFAGVVRVSAVGPGRIRARATGKRGSYRARLVFPKAGVWRITARAGGVTSRLGSVRVRRAPAKPLAFTEPTSIDLQLSGKLLLVEFSLGRVLQVDPRTGHQIAVVSSLVHPYAVVRASSGSIFLSVENQLLRISGDVPPTVVAEMPPNVEIGPVAAAANGDIYFSTATQIFRIPGGAGPAIHIAGTGVEGGGGDGGPALDAQFSSPHGLAVASDGALLVSDRGNDRVRRIDPVTGVITAFSSIGEPYGIDVAPNGTVYVIDGKAGRIQRLAPSGAQLGFLGPSFFNPYDVEAAGDGAAYLLQAGPTGYVHRIAPDGSVTTVSAR
jgi:sugar lactone lactonase YvrE